MRLTLKSFIIPNEWVFELGTDRLVRQLGKLRDQDSHVSNHSSSLFFLPASGNCQDGKLRPVGNKQRDAGEDGISSALILNGQLQLLHSKRDYELSG